MNKTHNLRRHPIYSIWRNIKTRCYNPKTHNYSNYGGKGIKLFQEWINNVEAFYKWSMVNGYRKGLTIDRRDSSMDYCPSNCRWVTQKIQQRNKTSHKNAKSKYIGVSVQFWAGRKMYLSVASINKRRVYLGSFINEVDAAKERDKYIKRTGLDGYNLNFA